VGRRLGNLCALKEPAWSFLITALSRSAAIVMGSWGVLGLGHM
jgi:hypothetical protein